MIPPGPTTRQVVHRPTPQPVPGHKQRRVDTGQEPGTTSSDGARIKELERENRELKRANEILLAASSFFARELDPRLPW